MASPLLDTAGPALEELEGFLSSDRTPDSCMLLSDLDGFLTAVAIGPELIMPSEWLPVIWGEGEPEFESMEEAQRIIHAIMGRYNEILDVLRHEPEAFEPIFWETAAGEVLAGDWAMGFMDGVKLRRGAWEPLIQSEEDGGLIAPIVALLHDEDGNPLLEGEGDELADLQRVAADLIASSVVAIDRFWRSGRRARRTEPKVGRNEPCPCGSGRKYKRCCGAH